MSVIYWRNPLGNMVLYRLRMGILSMGLEGGFRILGVNNSFSGNYPTHQQAALVAARMAKYGINCVRFHHTDTRRAPDGIWKADTEEKQTLDPDQLDRMDYFIAKLKENGIYANINLKIGREAVEADGIPFADQLPTYDKGPDHYYPRLIELQKNYARDLLTHRNPYTGNRYIEEPAIATIEINNESGLLHEWYRGKIDDLPEIFQIPLKADWNRFLQQKYKTTEALKTAWAPPSYEYGEELLKEPLQGWTFQQVEQGEGTREYTGEGPNGEESMKITTTRTGQEGWHVQAFYPNLEVKKGLFYRVTMWLRADRARDISVGLSMNHDPWSSLDSSVSVDVTTKWQKIEVAFSPSETESNGRLNLTDLGDELGTLWVAGPSMIVSAPQTISENEKLEDASIALIQRSEFGAYTSAAKRDMIEFLVEREAEYYRDMTGYLHNELNARSRIAGTQMNYGVVPSQMENDFIDHHAYWQHPVFPGRSWDSNNWYVRNLSIVNELSNPLTRLMNSRIEGRAYTVSEYNHPAPNTYASEVVPLAAAYAAFQDWDGIYFYSYSHSNDYANKSINNYFDIYGHTPKMLSMPAAANMLIRGDVSPAEDLVIASVSHEAYLNFLTDRNGNTSGITTDDFGMNERTPYVHRTAMRYGDDPQPIEDSTAEVFSRRLISDTEELEWNARRTGQSYVLIRSEKTKGFVGFTAQDSFDLGHEVQLHIGETIQNWANVLFTFIRSDDTGDHWLLTATGYAENQGMQWTNDDKESVGRNWGDGPPLVEAVPLRLEMQNQENRPRIFALDERGKRKEEISHAARIENGTLIINLLESQPSLWYEIVFEKMNVSGAEKY